MQQVLEYITKQGYTIDEAGVVKNPEGKVLSGSKSDGYLKFSVRTDFTTSYAMRFHKFQAYTKFGDKIFDNSQVVKHLNGITDDNNYDNIVLGKKSIGKPVEREVRGIPEDIKEKLVEDRKNNISYRKLVDKYGIPKSTIMDFVNRQIKKC